MILRAFCFGTIEVAVLVDGCSTADHGNAAGLMHFW